MLSKGSERLKGTRMTIEQEANLVEAFRDKSRQDKDILNDLRQISWKFSKCFSTIDIVTNIAYLRHIYDWIPRFLRPVHLQIVGNQELNNDQLAQFREFNSTLNLRFNLYRYEVDKYEDVKKRGGNMLTPISPIMLFVIKEFLEYLLERNKKLLQKYTSWSEITSTISVAALAVVMANQPVSAGSQSGAQKTVWMATVVERAVRPAIPSSPFERTLLDENKPPTRVDTERYQIVTQTPKQPARNEGDSQSKVPQQQKPMLPQSIRGEGVKAEIPKIRHEAKPNSENGAKAEFSHSQSEAQGGIKNTTPQDHWGTAVASLHPMAEVKGLSKWDYEETWYLLQLFRIAYVLTRQTEGHNFDHFTTISDYIQTLKEDYLNASFKKWLKKKKDLADQFLFIKNNKEIEQDIKKNKMILIVFAWLIEAEWGDSSQIFIQLWDVVLDSKWASRDLFDRSNPTDYYYNALMYVPPVKEAEGEGQAIEDEWNGDIDQYDQKAKTSRDQLIEMLDNINVLTGEREIVELFKHNIIVSFDRLSASITKEQEGILIKLIKSVASYITAGQVAEGLERFLHDLPKAIGLIKQSVYAMPNYGAEISQRSPIFIEWQLREISIKWFTWTRIEAIDRLANGHKQRIELLLSQVEFAPYALEVIIDAYNVKWLSNQKVQTLESLLFSLVTSKGSFSSDYYVSFVEALEIRATMQWLINFMHRNEDWTRILSQIKSMASGNETLSALISEPINKLWIIQIAASISADHLSKKLEEGEISTWEYIIVIYNWFSVNTAWRHWLDIIYMWDNEMTYKALLDWLKAPVESDFHQASVALLRYFVPNSFRKSPKSANNTSDSLVYWLFRANNQLETLNEVYAPLVVNFNNFLTSYEMSLQSHQSSQPKKFGSIVQRAIVSLRSSKYFDSSKNEIINKLISIAEQAQQGGVIYLNADIINQGWYMEFKAEIIRAWNVEYDNYARVRRTNWEVSSWESIVWRKDTPPDWIQADDWPFWDSNDKTILSYWDHQTRSSIWEFISFGMGMQALEVSGNTASNSELGQFWLWYYLPIRSIIEPTIGHHIANNNKFEQAWNELSNFIKFLWYKTLPRWLTKDNTPPNLIPILDSLERNTVSDIRA